MKTYIEDVELIDRELVINQKIEPLTELQLQKMFSLLKEVEGFRFGILETVLNIEIDGDNFIISSDVYDEWNEDGNEDEDGGWGVGVEYRGTLTDLNKMNTYENRFNESDELWSNPMSVVFEYEVVDGEVTPCTNDTHYGCRILDDEETVGIVKQLMTDGHISDNENGMISIYDDMTVIEVVGKEDILIPK